MRRALFIFVVLTVFAPSVVTGQDNTMVVDTEGRVLTPFVRAGKLASVRMEVMGGAENIESLRLHCRPMSSLDNTARPSDFDVEYLGVVSGTALVFQVPVATNTAFIFCSLLRQDNVPLTATQALQLHAALQQAKAQVATALATIVNSQGGRDWAAATKQRADAEAAHNSTAVAQRAANKAADTTDDARIQLLQADIAAFQQRETEGAVAEIKRLQEEVRKLRELISARAAALAQTVTEFAADVARLKDDEAAALQKVNDSALGTQWTAAKAVVANLTTQLEPGTQPQFTVLNYSHLLVGSDQRAVYYRLLRGKDDVVALERAARYPLLTTASHIYAIVLNRKLTELSEPFQLTFTATAGTPPNPAPVRPTFPAVAQAGELDRYAAFDDAYGDFLMSFGAPFKADTILKVTIATVLSQTTENTATTTTTDGDAKVVATKTVKTAKAELLKDEEFPQIRGLYSFNFTTGVAVSRLRDSSFVRRQVVPDDAATTEKNEAEYEDQTVVGNVSVKPIFAITVYFWPVDIQKRLSWVDRIRPAFLLGFSFQNPQDNIYIGGTIEPLKSLQILVGTHIGKITELRTPGAVNDPKSSTAPATDQRFDNALFAGVAFNIAFIKSIFGS